MNLIILMSELPFGPFGQLAPEFLSPTKPSSPINIMNLIGPKGIRADSIIIGTIHYHQTLTFNHKGGLPKNPKMKKSPCHHPRYTNSLQEGLNAAPLPSLYAELKTHALGFTLSTLGLVQIKLYLLSLSAPISLGYKINIKHNIIMDGIFVHMSILLPTLLTIPRI